MSKKSGTNDKINKKGEIK